MKGATEWTRRQWEPTIDAVPTTGDDAADAGDGDEEIAPPPALIVRPREPDRAVSRTIGAPSRAHVGPGCTVSFGLTPQGRSAVQVSLSRRSDASPRDNVLSRPHPRIDALTTRIVDSTRGRDDVLSRPHPRLDALPTRVATVTSFEVETDPGSGHG
ncbi:hypothetical protein [Paraliomyxa miuraensis]|uniref:hypothetical protein n=1 Tax=Paraliomyxa miuraensis TaxID=376150 RepID=UPI00224F9CA6|nr:hypothetical protein [Paraliomyxa miuraensis]MCX4244145.1 hypothetical protein [Paraliomyxa miuraensis]